MPTPKWPRWELLPISALRVLVEVLEFGAEKHSDLGWRYIPDREESHIRAMRGHFNKAIDSYEEVGVVGLFVRDEETGRPHLAHAVTRAIFLLAIWRETLDDFGTDYLRQELQEEASKRRRGDS